MSYLLAVNEYCLFRAAFGGAKGYQKGRRTNRKNILNRASLRPPGATHFNPPS
jgi:hypothetical protein